MKKIIAIVVSLLFITSISLALADEGKYKSSYEQDDDQIENDHEEIDEDEENDQEENDQDEDEQEEEAKNWKKNGEWKQQRQQELEKTKQEKANLKSEMRQKFNEEKCAKIQAKVKEHESKFGSSKIRHMSVYINMQNRIQKFINRFQAFYDANPGKGDLSKLTKLKEDFAKLKEMIATFQTNFSDYFTKLKAMWNLACSASEGQVRSSAAEIKVYLASVHENAAAIRTYMRTVILPDLLAVKQDIAQIQEATEKNENEDEDQEENDEHEDTNIPTVSITAPADGTTYTVGGTFDISATADSEEDVAKVEFYDGATLKGTDTTKPYTYSWTITADDNRAHSWTAKVYDEESPANTAISTPVVLNVNIGI